MRVPWALYENVVAARVHTFDVRHEIDAVLTDVIEAADECVCP
jgi:hypothetical protein